MISLEKPPLDELCHFGVRGMKWGVRKEEIIGNEKPRKPSYYDRSKADYLSRGFSESDAENLAKRKATIRTAAFIVGGVTLAVGAAFVARHYMIENKDTILKTGSKTFHIDRDIVKDLEPGRNFYVTVDQADRKAYQWRLNNPRGVARIERTFETTKNIRIPSPKKSKLLYDEFLKDPNSKELVENAFIRAFGKEEGLKSLNYESFVTYGPYFSKNDSWHPLLSFTEQGEQAWKSYQNFLMDKGYQGLLDANDRAKSHGFNVERPAIIFDAANHLKEVSRQTLSGKSKLKAAIPTIREVANKDTAALVATAAGISTVGIFQSTRALESYRKVYPNDKKTDFEIINLMSTNSNVAYDVYKKASSKRNS